MIDGRFSISFYKQEEQIPHWSLYSFTYGDAGALDSTDVWLRPYQQAYMVCGKKTDRLVKRLYTMLHTHEVEQYPFTIDPPSRLPHAALIGVAVPACVIEIGLKDDTQWKECAAHLTQALTLLIDELL